MVRLRPFRATILGATVLGATILGATILGATILGATILGGGHRETSAPSLLASGSGCNRPPGRVAHCECAGLSDAPGADRFRLSARRRERPLRAFDRSMAFGAP